MRNPLCYWFGCVPDYEHADSRHSHFLVPCSRCHAHDTDYADRVGDTRHHRLMQALGYWLWRRWVPSKCPDCHHRYGSHKWCDPLPF